MSRILYFIREHIVLTIGAGVIIVIIIAACLIF